MMSCFPNVVLKSKLADDERYTSNIMASIEVRSQPPSALLDTNAVVKSEVNGKVEIVSWSEKPDDPLYHRKAVGAGLALLKLDRIHQEDVIIELRLGDLSDEQLYQALMGVYHSLYDLKIRRGARCKEPTVLLDISSNPKKVLELTEAIARGVYIAKDIANLPPNILNPETITSVIDKLYKYHKATGLEMNVIDHSKLEDMGFGGIIAVGGSSARKPKLIEIVYKGASRDSHDFLLVGKTVVFDSGGLDLKTREAMDEMKYDKSGGASVAGIMATLSLLGVNSNVVGLLPVVENMPGPSAYKPRDIIRMYNGLTVEITNTDAEGRLILADALSYGIDKYKPKYIIDLATLTGSVVIALGKEAAGLFGTSSFLKQEIIRQSNSTGEKVWELPLYDEYGEKLKSAIADLKNSGGREGGASIAAWFLKQFIGDAEWVHLDIAGTAWISEGERPKPPYKVGSTGWGVETLSRVILSVSKSSF